jgi:hypothetical protein
VSAPPDAGAGVLLRHRDGELMVRAKLSEVPPAQLAALRAHKAELLPILEAFGEAQVLIRPATPVPDQPAPEPWFWSRPLRPRRKRPPLGTPVVAHVP